MASWLDDALGAYRGVRVLVTGHTGFKGSWLCLMLARAGAQVTGYSLEPPTNPSLFKLCGVGERIDSHVGDVRNLAHLAQVFDAARPQVVFHLAAQPIVRASYDDPRGTYETNVMGTVNILECVRACGTVESFLNVTTDKVYYNPEEPDHAFCEEEPLDGFDPYSNSKSCSELVTHAYAASFFGGGQGGLVPPGAPREGCWRDERGDLRYPALSTARAGNVIGGGDFAAMRIIPDCVRAAQAGEPVVIRNPHSTRPFQHVLEPLAAYLLIAVRQREDGALAGWYNVGPDDCDCVTSGELANLWCASWPGATWNTGGADVGGKHEAAFLRLSNAKLKGTFGWEPVWHIDEAVRRTAEWTRVWLDGGSVAACMERQIDAFQEAARASAPVS